MQTKPFVKTSVHLTGYALQPVGRYLVADNFLVISGLQKALGGLRILQVDPVKNVSQIRVVLGQLFDLGGHVLDRSGHVFAVEIGQGDVDLLAQVVGTALLVERVVIRPGRQHKLFARHAPADALVIVAVLLPVLLVVVAPHVRDVLEEEHHQSVVLYSEGATVPRKVSQARHRMVLISSWLMGVLSWGIGLAAMQDHLGGEWGLSLV